MMAFSVFPEEGIIAMDFISPKEVEGYIKEKNLPITHWKMYNYIQSIDELAVVYEKKDDEIVINRLDEK